MSDGDLDPKLVDRLRAIGIDPADPGDPGTAWRRLRERFDRRITLLDRYALEAASRGIRPEEIDDDTRARLGEEVLRVQFPGLELRPEAARRDGALRVDGYDVTWPRRFEAWREHLATELGQAAIRIEHVGSTAVPGLAAKPIVDIQVSVRDPEDEPGYVPAVESTGLVLRSREPGHRYFRPPPARPRDVHLHVCRAGSVWERDHLLFRDYLRAHAGVARAYASLKLDLARRHAADRLAYTDAKSDFILDALDDAAAWAERTGWRLE